MRVLCVARHEFLSAHFCRYFQALGFETHPVIGLPSAVDAAAALDVDAVVCDYDLLATIALDAWERDPLLSRLPVIAVSLTRRPDEVHALDVNGIAGFLYLPTIDRDQAQSVLAAAASCRRRGVSAPTSLPWPAPRVAQYQ